MQKAKGRILGLYPTTKLWIIIFIIIAGLIFSDYRIAFLTAIVYMIIALISGKLKEFISILKKLFIIVLILLVIQTFFFPGTEILWSWKFLHMKKEGLEFALDLGSKIVAIGGGIGLYFGLTPIKDFVYALEKVGMSPTAAYVVLATMQMIPQMGKRLVVIMNAQKSRGVETEGNILVRTRAFLPILVPLILSAISETEERALTLESRAFTAVTNKSYIYPLEYTAIDKVIKVVCVSCLFIIFGGRIVLWIL